MKNEGGVEEETSHLPINTRETVRERQEFSSKNKKPSKVQSVFLREEGSDRGTLLDSEEPFSRKIRVIKKLDQQREKRTK